MKHEITVSQSDGFFLTTEHGCIEFRPVEETNEIWWVESKKPGHGSILVDLMQSHYPAKTIAWGETSESGFALMEKWHKNHPEIEKISGAHENQFNPFS